MQYSQRSTHSLVLGSLKECCSTLGRQCLNGWPGVCPWFTTLRKEVPCRWTQWLHLHTRGNVPASLSPERASICGEISPGNLLICSQHFDAFILKKALKLQLYLVFPLWSMFACTVSLWWFECPCRLCCLSVTITKPQAWMAVLSFEQPSKFGWSACFHPTWKYGMGILLHMSVPACRCSRSQATCRPNPARKGGMMQHVPLGGQETHLQSHSASTCMMISWLFPLSFGPVIFRGTQYGRSEGDRSIPRQRPPFATCNLVKSTTSTTTSQRRRKGTLPLGQICASPSLSPSEASEARINVKEQVSGDNAWIFITSQKSNSIHLFLLHLHLNTSKHVHPYYISL